MAKGPTKSIRIVVSAKLHAYLGYLSRHTMLGASENDVAAYILTRRLEEMLAANYHKTEIPPDDSIT